MTRDGVDAELENTRGWRGAILRRFVAFRRRATALLRRGGRLIIRPLFGEIEVPQIVNYLLMRAILGEIRREIRDRFVDTEIKDGFADYTALNWRAALLKQAAELRHGLMPISLMAVEDEVRRNGTSPQALHFELAGCAFLMYYLTAAAQVVN